MERNPLPQESAGVPGLSPHERRALADSIRMLRARQHMTQEQVSEAVGLGRNYVSEIESGRRRPSWEGVVLVARGLGVELGELVEIYEEQVRR